MALDENVVFALYICSSRRKSPRRGVHGYMYTYAPAETKQPMVEGRLGQLWVSGSAFSPQTLPSSHHTTNRSVQFHTPMWPKCSFPEGDTKLTGSRSTQVAAPPNKREIPARLAFLKKQGCIEVKRRKKYTKERRQRTNGKTSCQYTPRNRVRRGSLDVSEGLGTRGRGGTREGPR